MVTTKDEQRRKYLVGLSKHILVQEGDFIRAGMPISDGATAPRDILNIKGTICSTTILSKWCTRSISFTGGID